VTKHSHRPVDGVLEVSRAPTEDELVDLRSLLMVHAEQVPAELYLRLAHLIDWLILQQPWTRRRTAHKDVAECAVIGVADPLKGEVPCGLIVLKAGVNRAAGEIEQECVGLVRDKIGPVAAFKLTITVARLPKTISGKILRKTMKKIADGEPWTMPATIDDPAILEEIGAALKGKGLGA
jgi:AMP-binding enzyme C-terminal domain